MPSDKTSPIRFWIGLHKDGSGRECIVDTDGGPMEGVKRAWSEKNPNAITTMETVIQPELSFGSLRLLELLVGLETHLGDSRLTETHKLLQEIAMAAYEAGLQNGGRSPKRP